MSTVAREKLVTFTERLLTWRKRRRLRKKQKQQSKHPVVDWIEAFLWAAGVVLLINQYALQAYQIPSGSMMNTLLQGDRIFVNKLVYGPELLPGLVKLPGFAEPERGEVIIFENPSYISRGTAFDILQRVLYMVTLSIVDIDRDEAGQPRAHFLIKRAVGVGGDRFRVREGSMQILLPGESEWQDEAGFATTQGLGYEIRRIVRNETIPLYRDAAITDARTSLGLSSSDDSAFTTVQRERSVDPFEYDRLRTRYLLKANPHESLTQARDASYTLGWYVPEDRILPIGDNRDNSRDGRYFGAVSTRDVLGRAMFKYWPIPRIGAIR